MRITKTTLCIFLSLALLLALLPGCSDNSSTNGEFTFSASAGLDDNGFWKGVKALDYVTLFPYQAMTIPREIHQVLDEDIQNEIETILADFPGGEHVMDRAVVNGDTVNIDYVGSVDGVEFDNGSTEGMGTIVIVGVTEYIEGFLEQLIGHMPGDTFDLKVRFPDNYHEETLKGKDAVFVTTVNYIIVEDGTAVLSDAFVADNLAAYYGWKTVSEMREGVRNVLRNQAVMRYIEAYFSTEVTISSVPTQMMKYQEDAMVDHYQRYAASNDMAFEQFLTEYVGVSNVEELIERYQRENLSSAKFYLVVQAIAEHTGIKVTEDDLNSYIGENTLYAYEEQYGIPYTKHQVLCQMILDLVVQSATFE